MKLSKIKQVKKMFENSLWKDDHEYKNILFNHLDNNNEEETVKILNSMVVNPSSYVNILVSADMASGKNYDKKKYWDMAVQAIKKEEDAIHMYSVLFVGETKDEKTGKNR